MALEVVEDLARAEHEAGDLGLVDPRLGEHGEEPRLRQVLDPRRRLRQAQERLRGHDHERALLGHARLTAQHVEVLGRRGEVGDPDVALGRERQEALQAAGGVLGARALVAVRQQHRQPRALAPLGERGDDELVDDHLRRVHEVAELRLPQHEAVRCLHRVAVLEAEAGDLRQRRVVQLHRREGAREVLDGRDPLARLVSCRTRWRWEKVPRSTSWPVRRIGRPLAEQRGERERLGMGPVDPALGADRVRRFSSWRTSFGWTLKPSGNASSSSLRAISRSALTAVLTSGDAVRSSS